MTLNDRARLRLREQKAVRDVTERDIAGFVKWSQSKVAQKLLGVTPITLNELESLCFALNVRPTEVVREQGLEFCAEMTPTELRLLETIRALPRPAYDGLLKFLQIHEVERRGITKKRDSIGKPRSA